MSRSGAAPRAAVSVSNARAEASRRNGARSRGPRTPEGKARSAQNAIKHGLRAGKFLVVPGEDACQFDGFEAALLAELAPRSALQAVLARQVVSAAWRLARVDRMETEMLIFRDRREGDLGLAVTRDANTARALPTLVRYRAAAHAEFLRSLKTLQTLQAEAAKARRSAEAAAPLEAKPGQAGAAPDQAASRSVRARNQTNPRRAARPAPVPAAARPRRQGTVARPNEPETPAQSRQRSAGIEARPNEPEPPVSPALLRRRARRPAAASVRRSGCLSLMIAGTVENTEDPL
jgi:hypothetical protein